MSTLNSIANDHSQIYLAIGKFSVRFEYLVHAIRSQLIHICGPNAQTMILVEDYTANQAIEVLSKQIEWQLKQVEIDPLEAAYYRFIITDLRTLNTNRNKIIHRFWFFETPEGPDAITSGIGSAYSLTKADAKMNNLDIEAFTLQADTLYRMLWTSWRLFDARFEVPPFNEMWHRSAQGLWTDSRIQ